MNLLHTFLTQLGVRRISEHYCEEQFLSTPLSDTLLGIKNLLTRMGVPTRGVRYEDKDQNPVFPSIVHLGSNFEVATQKTWEKQKPYWDGIALIPQEFDHTKVVEPDYVKHLLMRIFEGLCVIGVFALIPISIMFATEAFQITPTCCLFDPVILVLMILHLLGLSLGVLLLQKSITGHSKVGDKLCSALGEKHSCGDILDSPAAKILGFSWSEIGFGYFLAQLTALLFIPDQNFVIVSFCAMLFAFWSIGYQWKHHSWCVLCILTQVVLWAEGILIMTTMGFMQFFYFESVFQSIATFILTCLFIGFTILVTHFVSGYLTERHQRERSQWYMRGMLRRKDIFQPLLLSRPDCPYTEADINERQSCPDSSLEDAVIVFTRPKTCGHCKAHLKKEEEFVAKMGDRVALWHINLDLLDQNQKSETYQRLGLNATPTILYRHHILPEQYSLTDLQELL